MQFSYSNSLEPIFTLLFIIFLHVLISCVCNWWGQCVSIIYYRPIIFKLTLLLIFHYFFGWRVKWKIGILRIDCERGNIYWLFAIIKFKLIIRLFNAPHIDSLFILSLIEFLATIDMLNYIVAIPIARLQLSLDDLIDIGTALLWRF